MAVPDGSNILRQLRFAVASWQEDARTDAELLARFAQTRDEPAFATLVGRHSQLVWGVCLRVLRNHADAEDATQAVFLRLARDAKRILNREALAGWLVRVARDCAVDLQRSILRQRRIEERLAAVAERTRPTQPADLRVLLDDELAQLPPSHRAALVLCGIEGRTFADAAIELGCSVAAVHRRFVRAQTALRRRLARHGPAATAMLAAVLAGAVPSAASAAPPALLARAVEAGVRVADGGGRTSRFVAAVAALGVMVVGGAAFLSRPATSPNIPIAEPSDARPAGATVAGVVRGPDGKPVAGASVAALGRRPFGPGERGLRDDVLAAATTDADGRFSLPVAEAFATWFPDRAVTVRAVGAGFAPATRPVRLPAREQLELGLAAASHLAGTLLDPARRPATGVRVAVVRIGDAVAEPVVGAAAPAPPAWPTAVTTDAAGRFVLPNLGGCENVWVRVGDSRWATDTFRVDGRREFRVEPACPLAVEVVAADTGAPLGGARVTFISERVGSHPHFCTNAHGVLGPYSVPSDVDALTDAAGRTAVGFAAGDRVEVLVHPPHTAGPYLGVRTTAEVTAGRPLVVRVPRGRWVAGTITDAAGRPLAGASAHWGREDGDVPEWRGDTLSGRDAIVRTAADGTFRLAVPAGPCSVRAYGPTLDHPAVPVVIPGKSSAALFAHAVARVDVPADRDPPPVRFALDAGTRVTAAIGGASDRTVALCSGRVSPVRGYAALPLPVVGGRVAVPGCRPGSTPRVYVLDPVSRRGCVADLMPGKTLSLAECGRAGLRVVGPDGAGVAGVDVTLSLLVDREGAAGEADAQPVEWFDPFHYPKRPKSDAAGRVELPALIPGARYAVAVGAGANKVAAGQFTAAAGKTTELPDVTVEGTR